MAKIKYKISIIGAGKVGSVLAALLYEKGNSIISIIDTNLKTAAQLAKKVNCKKVSNSCLELHKDTEILFITTPDDSIETIAKIIAQKSKLKFNNLLTIHTSGVYSSEILMPLKRKGSSILSFHPVQSFPKGAAFSELKTSVKGVYINIEGDAKGLVVARSLASQLGMKALVINKSDKPLFHLACVFASNYIVAILDAVYDISEKLKLKKNWVQIFLPLIITTLENVFRISPKKALTGPIERGDLNTIRKHINIIKKRIPKIASIYLTLTVETARRAFLNGSISKQQLNKIITIARGTT